MTPASMASRTSTSTKCSSPITRIVVVPAARSRRRFRVAASACGVGPRQSWPSWSPWLGTREAWLWQSMRPGITKRSPRSNVSIPGAPAPPPAGPTLVMRPSVTTTRASRTGGAPVPSNSVPQRRARTVISALADTHAVVAPRRVGRDVAFADVATDGLAVTLGGGSPAATAAAHDPHGLAGGDRMLGGLAHVTDRAVGRPDLDVVHGAVEAAAQTPRRRRLALEAEGDEGRRQELVHALDAQAAAKLPGAAGVRP